MKSSKKWTPIIFQFLLTGFPEIEMLGWFWAFCKKSKETAALCQKLKEADPNYFFNFVFGVSFFEIEIWKITYISTQVIYLDMLFHIKGYHYLLEWPETESKNKKQKFGQIYFMHLGILSIGIFENIQFYQVVMRLYWLH